MTVTVICGSPPWAEEDSSEVLDRIEELLRNPENEGWVYSTYELPLE